MTFSVSVALLFVPSKFTGGEAPGLEPAVWDHRHSQSAGELTPSSPPQPASCGRGCRDTGCPRLSPPLRLPWPRLLLRGRGGEIQGRGGEIKAASAAAAKSPRSLTPPADLVPLHTSRGERRLLFDNVKNISLNLIDLCHVTHKVIYGGMGVVTQRI